MWNIQDEEFFIGYAPPMPPRLARFVRRVIVVIAGLMLVWAIVVAAGHVRLEGGTFEFGQSKNFTGTIVEQPYPALHLDGVDANAAPWPLLVAPGKHGIDALVSGLEGRQVSLTGTRIQRGRHTMIEVEPASLVFRPGPQPGATRATPFEPPGEDLVEVTGEIVDSKCFLGVMVPGAGKTHKDCASLCLRGGIPPAIYVQDRAGRSSLMLLTGASGESVGARAAQMAGEAISVSGFVTRQGGWLVLRTNPASWRPVRQ